MNNNLPKICICLAAYNGSQWLSDQINSCLTQSDASISIFISIDQSTDETEVLANVFSVKNTNVFILPNGYYFGSASTNFFRLITEIDFTKFDYIAFSDQDDIWLSSKLKRAYQIITSSQVDAYSGNVTALWPNGKRILIEKSQKQQKWDYMFESAGPGCTFVLTQNLALDLQNLLITKQSQIQKVDLHDWFIYAFARSRGYIWHIDHESHMLYRQHDSNVIGANVGITAKILRWKKLRSGWLINQAIIIADILNYDQYSPIKELKRYSILDRFYLILNINKLRRRFRDRIALLLLFLLPSS